MSVIDCSIREPAGHHAMQPSVIDWQSKHDVISLTFLPRQSMHRTIWRWIVLIALAQAAVAAAAFLVLQKPWLGWNPSSAWLEVGMALSAGLLVTLALLPFMARRLRRWTGGLRELHEAIRVLARGADPRPAAVGGADEVAYLLLAFNDMAGRLLAHRRALLEANAELEDRVADRTEALKAVNLELERKNVELEELTDTALRFTDDVAHEFRTPLTVVMEFASIINDGLGGAVTDKQAEYLRFIIDASKDLANLVDDFLDSSKLRARSLRVDRRPHALGAILDSIWPMLELRASGKKVALERRIADGLPAVYVDADKMRRSIVNLVVNAIKFSKQGASVIIAAQAIDDGGVRIDVTDHGPGLTAEELNTLFERFKQGGQGKRSSSKGFGLGLNIVRDLVALNLGSMLIRSAPGKGSTFSFTVPADNTPVIIDRHLERVLDRSPAAAISALRLRRDGASCDLNELHAFLASVTYPTDLQLRGADERSIVLVGKAADPGVWIDKLAGQDKERRESRPDEGLAPIQVERLGTWPAGDAREQILSHVNSRPVMEMTAHA